MLNIVVEGIDGNNTSGNVTFDKSMYQEPAFSVTTNVPHHMNHRTKNISDYIQNTYYQSNRKNFNGDNWTLKFTTPITTSQIAIVTGNLDTDKDMLEAGKLEYTINGVDWIAAGPFIQGSTMMLSDNPKFIKALRITATANQEGWLIIQDPFISQ